MEYLNKMVDFKDTATKTPFMVHLMKLVVDTFPDSTDLYTELPHVHGVAKVSW